MYIKSSHARGVSRLTTLRAVLYELLPPSQNGYMKRLKARFGSQAILFLNTEALLTILLRNLPDRIPGMYVGVDSRHVKRFGKAIERVGLKVAEFNGQKTLGEVMLNDRLIALIIPDNYEVSSPRYKRQYASLDIPKIVYQNRKKPHSVALEHDIYLWEPKGLPRTISGCVVVVNGEKLEELGSMLKKQNSEYPRLEASAVMKDLRLARKGKENRFRRVDRRPPRILPRMLYDFYR